MDFLVGLLVDSVDGFDWWILLIDSVDGYG